MSNPSRNVMSDPAPTLMSDLPQGYVISFSLRSLRHEARWILEWFEDHTSGNQWIVVLGLSSTIIETLTTKRNALHGVPYRFQWEGTTGLIKVVPRGEHEGATSQFSMVIHDELKAMGLPRREVFWLGSTTYHFGTNKGKEADNSYLPPSRHARPIKNAGYPSLVIETGVSESLGRLRQDARKWFADSAGDVRIVILINVRENVVCFEQWQLAPSTAPRPLTKRYIDTLRAQTPNIPPLTGQPAQLQQVYCAHHVDVTRNSVAGMPNVVDGAPMILPFIAIQDRPPGPGERDIVVGQQDFEEITDKLL
ncbi:uncharacterized protein N7515_006605 [Penicillium bovifimosum]|uniref:Uncharacterized protein n=1 Tax=Penicillium bovifimosum TaxID=126998 RepID=A0A9W9L0X7_9EURO|nr:uncharacterized protein N7515_006605 [Penicillium bovifimosum]KAJ5130566.1 hypothetical protein N7515_006605 [Penicillium bovifimosum]